MNVQPASSESPSRRRRLFVWLLPLVWTTVAWRNFSHPGDQFSGFAAGAMAGMWAISLPSEITTPAQFLTRVLVAGAATMALAGALLDRLHVRLVPWLIVVCIASGTILLTDIASHTSLQHALDSRGSYQAFLLPAINLGQYFASLVMFVFTGVTRHLRTA